MRDVSSSPVSNRFFISGSKMLWRAHYIESWLVCYICFLMEPMKGNCLMLHPLETGRMSVHKASPLLHWSACGWLVRRLVVKCTRISHQRKAHGWTPFLFSFPSRHQYLMNGCEWPWLFTALVLHYCLYCSTSLPSSIHPKLVLLQRFEDNLNVSSFISFPQIKMYTRTRNTIQKDR